MQKLLLTRDESKLFCALSDVLQNSWVVESEEISMYETPEELHMRYRIAHFTDPRCTMLMDAANNLKDAQEFESLAAGFDLSALPQEQMAELFFVLGTRVISAMIVYLLSHVQDDEDLEGIAVLTNVRRMLKDSNSSQ